MVVGMQLGGVSKLLKMNITGEMAQTCNNDVTDNRYRWSWVGASQGPPDRPKPV